MYNAKTLTLTQIAKLGLWLDDPYGDGIRLDIVRHPDAGRIAAKNELRGEPDIFGETVIRAKYEAKVRSTCFTKAGKLYKHIERNLC